MSRERASPLNEARLTPEERDYVQRLKLVTYAQLEEETREAKADVAKLSKDLALALRDQYNAFMYYNSAEHGVLLRRTEAFPIAMRRSKTVKRRSSSGSKSGSGSGSKSRSASASRGAGGAGGGGGGGGGGGASRRSSSQSILRKLKAKYDGAVGVRNNTEQRYVTALKRYFILMSFRDLSMAKNMYRREMSGLSDNLLAALEEWADQRVLTGRANIVDRRRNYDDALDREDRRFEEIRHWAEGM